MFRVLFLAVIFSISSAAAGFCGEADVIGVAVKQTGSGIYRFDVTVRHADAGWDHYADQWEVLAPDGTVLGSRTLYHPHVDEQPFTRSLSGVSIPATISRVTVRARDSVHGYGGKTFTVDLPR
jgi:hypothetical protein